MDVFRNQAYSTLIAVVATLFFCASAINVAVRGGDWVPVAVVGALSAFCLLRLARAGVYANDEGIRVLNPLRTVRVPWDHVLRFTLRPHKGFPALGFAELIDGREVELWGVQSRSSTATAKKVPEDLVAQLNERLARERERRQPTP